ncbi:MAG TPA: universal stress protein [Candidatus Methanomethylophilaceae archaeon]|nr:universal stress protein [Candidatus Methanomethylophilaceae archaeon]
MTQNEKNNEILSEKKILLATDGSMPAIAATKKAIDMAAMMGATVYVVTVPEKTPLTVLERMEEYVDESRYIGQIADGPKIAHEYGLLRHVDVREIQAEDGPIVWAILHVADEIKPDMIVLGNSGRSGWERIALGSVAEGVMRRSPYPVTVTKGWDPDEMEDILSLAKGLIVPSLDRARVMKITRIPLADLKLGRRLGVSGLALLVFLIPYFGLGILNTFFKDLATSVVTGGFTVAVLWIMALFPLGILTGVGFHYIAGKYD